MHTELILQETNFFNLHRFKVRSQARARPNRANIHQYPFNNPTVFV